MPHAVRITPIGILSEVLLWGTLLFLALILYLSVVGLLGRFIPNDNQQIYVYFQDSSQLSKGAPVKFMGVELGYVEEVKPLEDIVEVKLRLNRSNMLIPEGSRFTIQFNGLAGAKTLEIFPPDYPVVSNGYTYRNYSTEDPIRIRDVFESQTVVGEAFEITFDNVYHALGEVNSPDELRANVQYANNRLDGITSGITRFTRQVKDKKVGIHDSLADATERIITLQKGANSLQPYVTKSYLNNTLQPKATATVDFIQNTEDGLREVLSKSLLNTKVRQTVKDVNEDVLTVRQNTPDIVSGVDKLNSKLGKTNQVLSNSHHYFTSHDVSKGLQQGVDTTDRWDDGSEMLLRRLDDKKKSK